MKVKKLLAGIITSVVYVAMTSIVVGAACLFNAEEPQPELSSSSGMWLLKIYNDPNESDFANRVEYDIDYSAVTGVKFIVTVPEENIEGVANNHQFWDGKTGGAVAFSISGGDIVQGTTAFDTYYWPVKQYWGVTDEAFDFGSTDPNKDDDPSNDMDISYEKVGDYTYQLIANGFENPLANGDAKTIGCMQVCLQEWGSTLSNLKILQCEVINESGETLLAFNGNGQLIDKTTGSVIDTAKCVTQVRSDGTLEVTGYTGNPVNLEIPEEINGKKVTSISSSAFEGCATLKSITIPDSVTSIGDAAFENCSNLTSITIPDGVTSIGVGVFESCFNLTSITIPDSVTSIGGWAFKDCTSLTSITISDSVTSIGDYTFFCCLNLTSISIPYSVTNIGGSAFSGCSSLTGITIPVNVTSIGDAAFENCSNLTSITIPDGVTSIGVGVFESCFNLTSITIPDSVTSIGGWAFKDCTSLTSITISDSVTSIGDYTFFCCLNLTSISIPYSVTNIGSRAFSGCSRLTRITIPDGVTSLDGAFAGCSSLTSVTIPDSVTSLDGAFSGCSSLTSVTIPDGVTEIGDYTFYNCKSLKSIMIPNGVTSIGIRAFAYCFSLTNIKIPDGVKSIDHETFLWCKSLTSITLSDSVTSIGHFAFDNCKSLTAIDVAEGNTIYSSLNGVLFNKDKTELINYPQNKADVIYKIPDSVTSIGERAFLDCSSLISIILPDGVTEICEYAFCDCTSLTNITIPDSVTKIGFVAFSDCSSLTSITISDGVTSIDDSAFWGCTSLTEIKVATENSKYASVNGVLYNKDKTVLIRYPAGKKDKNYKILDGVTGINNSAFSDCTELTSVTIPDSVTSLDGAFSRCSSLKSITISNNVTSIGRGTFSGCSNLTSIVIPDSVTNIYMYAFEDCTSLTSITIPNSVTSIGDSAFENCTSLKSITIPNSVTSIGDNAFWGCISLTEIKVATENSKYASVNGVLYNKDKTVLIRYPAGKKDKNYKILDGVTGISNYAFEDCAYLTNIIIPTSIESISECAISRCASLTSITIPDSVTSIDLYAFSGCTSLKSITIPDGVTSIAWSAFSGCTSLTTITIPNSVTSIGKYAFGDCISLTSVTIPDGVTEIDWGAFGYYYYNENDVYPNKIDNFKIYCYSGTAGEQYAKENGFECELTDHKHIFDNWKITNAATCTATGTKTRTCSVCGKVETATIAKVAHKYVNTVVKPTYTAQGYTLHKCSVCGESKKDTYTAKLTLAKVTGVKLGGRAADALRINWTKNASADGYIVEMYQGNKWVRVAKITSNSTTTYRKAGLKAGTVYKFRVRAYKMSGSTAIYSEYSATVAARTNPSVIKGAKLGGRAADALRINWTKNTSADGYIVEMYQGNKWIRVAKITNSNTTTFRKAGLKASTVYKFRVKAYKMSGSTALYGNYSATVTARTNPSTVNGVKIAGKAKDALRVNWAKNSSAQGYIVEMYKGGKWVRVAKIANSNTTTFRKSGLAKNTTYKFRVKAYYMSGKTALYGGYGSVSGKTLAK